MRTGRYVRADKSPWKNNGAVGQVRRGTITKDSRFQDDLAFLFSYLARRLPHVGRKAEALPCTKRGSPIWEKLVVTIPTSRYFAASWRTAYRMMTPALPDGVGANDTNAQEGVRSCLRSYTEYRASPLPLANLLSPMDIVSKPYARGTWRSRKRNSESGRCQYWQTVGPIFPQRNANCDDQATLQFLLAVCCAPPAAPRRRKRKPLRQATPHSTKTM